MAGTMTGTMTTTSTQAPPTASPVARRSLPRLWLGFGAQIVVLGALWAFYQWGRSLASGDTSTAMGHAKHIWGLERDLRLPSEARIQGWALHSHDLVRVINAIYANVHFPAIGITFIVLYFRRPAVYRWFRNLLVLTTGLALIGHIAYPLAPPRLRPDFGMVDTGTVFGQSTYATRPGTGFANQYAAMPSMHVAWATAIAIAVVVCLRSRWRWLAFLYSFSILMVVVITGNHYWVDGVVGVGLLGLSVLILRRQLPTAAQRHTPPPKRALAGF
jgi:hypothetical protein